MTKCKECSATISTKADACPSCGAKRPRTSAVTWIATVFFGLVGLVAAIGSFSPPPAATPKTAEQTKEDRADTARFSMASNVAKSLRAQAKDPDSVKFDQFGVSRDGKTACGTYRGKNGFGALTKEAVVVHGDTALPASSANWKKHCQGLIDYLYAVN